MKTNSVPKIRFKGFTDDWEQRKLGDEVRIVMGQSPNSENYTDDPNDYILVQGNADMKNGRVLPRVWTTQVTKQAEKDDLILSVRAPVGDIGKTAYDVVIGRGVAAIKGNEFIFQNLGKMKSDGYWTRYSTGSTFESINSTDIKEAIISVPAIEEQNKIGSFFKQLDNIIALHQRKCEQTKELKKFMLQKMFPKKGEKNPEIRFPGFTDDWEQRKFGELYEKVSRKNDMTYGTEQIISVANMYYKVDANVKRQDYLKTYNIFELGDIAFEGNKSKHFAHGRFVENTIGNGIVSHVFDVFKPIMDFNLSFWKYYINYEGVMGPILTRVTKASTMMTNLVAKDFLNEDILVPSIAEQQKIGEYLSNLDHLITLHQRKCEQLKELKKFMLQNMFPKKG